jgi:hypothetical protein
MELSELLALRDDPQLLKLIKARPRNYNRQAAALERGEGLRGADVLQVAVPDGTRLIGRLQADPRRVTEALRVGARTISSTLLSDAVDLCWQPMVYGAHTDERLAPRPLPAASARRRASAVRAAVSGWSSAP